MRAANFTVSSMHGEMVQKERDTIMGEFRGGTSYVRLHPCGHVPTLNFPRRIAVSSLQRTSGHAASMCNKYHSSSTTIYHRVSCATVFQTLGLTPCCFPEIVKTTSTVLVGLVGLAERAWRLMYAVASRSGILNLRLLRGLVCDRGRCPHSSRYWYVVAVFPQCRCSLISGTEQFYSTQIVRRSWNFTNALLSYLFRMKCP